MLTLSVQLSTGIILYLTCHVVGVMHKIEILVYRSIHSSIVYVEISKKKKLEIYLKTSLETK